MPTTSTVTASRHPAPLSAGTQLIAAGFPLQLLLSFSGFSGAIRTCASPSLSAGGPPRARTATDARRARALHAAATTAVETTTHQRPPPYPSGHRTRHHQVAFTSASASGCITFSPSRPQSSLLCTQPVSIRLCTPCCYCQLYRSQPTHQLSTTEADWPAVDSFVALCARARLLCLTEAL